VILAIVVISLGYGDVAEAGATPTLAPRLQIIGPHAWQYLIGGRASIAPAGAGKVKISGTTLANGTMDIIAVTLYLELYGSSTGSWERIDNWPRSLSFASSVEESAIANVQSGRTYRLQVLHEIRKSGVYESDWSITDEIIAP